MGSVDTMPEGLDLPIKAPDNDVFDGLFDAAFSEALNRDTIPGIGHIPDSTNNGRKRSLDIEEPFDAESDNVADSAPKRRRVEPQVQEAEGDGASEVQRTPSPRWHGRRLAPGFHLAETQPVSDFFKVGLAGGEEWDADTQAMLDEENAPHNKVKYMKDWASWKLTPEMRAEAEKQGIGLQDLH